MLTPELKAYLRGLARMEPPPVDHDLRIALASAGWDDSDIREAVAFYQSFEAPAPVPTPAPAPAVPQQVSPSVVFDRPEGIEASSLSPSPQTADVVSDERSQAAQELSMEMASLEGGSPSGNMTASAPVASPERNPFRDVSVNARPAPVVPDDHPAMQAFSLRPAHEPQQPVPLQSKQPRTNLRPGYNPLRSSGPTSPVRDDPRPTQPRSPRQDTVAVSFAPGLGHQSSGRFRKATVIGIIIIGVLGLGGGVAFAFYKGWIPVPSIPFLSKDQPAPYTEESFLSSLAEKIKAIKVASYETSLSATIEDRDGGARPFSLSVPEAEAERLLSYKRDQDRFRALLDLRNSLSSYSAKNKGQYPNDLSALDVAPKDPKGGDFPYSVSSTGRDYELSVTFETPEAIETVNGADNVAVDGATATFTSSSSSYFYFSGEPKRPALVGFLEQSDQMLALVPSDLKARLSVLGSIRRDEVAVQAGGRFRGALSVDTSNFKIDVDVEGMTIGGVGGDYYVRLNKFPSSLPFFGTFSVLVGEWIQLDPNELSSGLVPSVSPDDIDEVEAKQKKVFELYEALVKIADDEKVVRFKSDPVKEKEGGVTVYRYDLSLDRESLLPFYRRALSKVEEMFGDTGSANFSPGIIELLESDEFGEVFDYLKDNNTISLWFDAETGFPVRARLESRIVPGDRAVALKQKQLKTSIELSLSDINVPVDIEAPKQFMSQEDAIIKITGESREEYRMKKQLRNVEAVRSAISAYRTYTGTLPATLLDLTKKGSVLVKANVPEPDFNTKWIQSTYDNQPFLSRVPEDALTGKPYGYAVVGDEFTLMYEMAAPQYKAGTNPSAYYAIDRERVPGKTSYLIRYVNGVNTATSKVVSKEAIIQSTKDADADLVADALETLIGTDPAKKDTDADGYSDADELTRGTNPSGPGTFER